MSFWEIIKEHIGHNIQAVTYGRYANAIECVSCGEILFDGEQP